MTNAQTCTVCVVGANAEVSSRVAALLENQRDRFDARWQIADHASADLLLVDAESVYGHMDWLRAKASGRLVAACSASPQAHAGDLCLPKPILAGNLVSLLNQVGAKLGTIATEKVAIVPALITPAAATELAAFELMPIESDPISPAAIEPLSLEARLSLSKPTALENVAPPLPTRPVSLIELLEETSPVNRLRLVADGLPTLLLDPAQRSWRAEGSLKSMAGWCNRAIAPEEIQRPNAAEFAAQSAVLPAHPYARLRWLAHLLRGDGQLDGGLDTSARFKLSRWPQSEREFPKHFRIATVMLKQMASLDDIAAQSGATRADVANFVNAYHAIGYVEAEVPAAAQDDARRGLFARMRRSSAN